MFISVSLENTKNKETKTHGIPPLRDVHFQHFDVHRMQPDFFQPEIISCIIFTSISHSTLHCHHMILLGQESVLVKIVDSGAGLSGHLLAVGKWT